MASKRHSPAARRALVAVLAGLTLGVPTAAYPISLSQLLHLPLEQLLRLEITSMGSAAGQHSGGPHGR
jgi:uncharacterized protein YjeT (DUF2065 family)